MRHARRRRHGGAVSRAHRRPRAPSLKLAYRFEPGHPLDGVTATVPLHLLNQLEAERVRLAGAGPDPREDRAALQGAAEAAAAASRAAGGACDGVSWKQAGSSAATSEQRARRGAGALRAARRGRAGLSGCLGRRGVAAASPDELSRGGRSGARARGGARPRGAQGRSSGRPRSSPSPPRTRASRRPASRAWDFGELPAEIAFTRGGRRLTGYPALVDEGDSVAIRLFDTRAAADAAMRGGVRRLMRLALKEQMRQLEKSLPGFTQAALLLRSLATADELQEDLVDGDRRPRVHRRGRAAAQREGVRGAQAARAHAAAGGARSGLPPARRDRAQEYQRAAAEARRGREGACRSRRRTCARSSRASCTRASSARRRGSGCTTCRAISRRCGAPARQVSARTRSATRSTPAASPSCGSATRSARSRLQRAGEFDARLEDFRWRIEELRVSLFAQELKTPYPVSFKRLDKLWREIAR